MLLFVAVGEQGMHLAARLLRVVRSGDRRDGVDGRSGGGQHVGQGRPLTRGVGVLLLGLGHVIGAIQHCPGGRAQGDVGPLQAGERAPQPRSRPPGAAGPRVQPRALLGLRHRLIHPHHVRAKCSDLPQPVIRSLPRPPRPA